SPRNEKEIISELCEELVEINPANKDLYEKNAKEYIKEIDEIDRAFRRVVDSASTKTIVVADRFPILYFTRDYGLEFFAAFPGCAHETEANANTVAFLINLVRERGINAILHMELANTMLSKVISEETGAKVLEFNSAHNVTKKQFDEGLTWTQIMRSNIDVLKEALD
ncbi:MAG: metal ABC transporter substrate-binding protein, partial [Sphaerochaetaceae bacterium]|nr:metal ABC transporter substrate-binding protein [Sphaerochaetaceae bacterium]